MIGRVGLASGSRRFGPRASVVPATILCLAVFILLHDRAAAQLNVQSPPAQSPQAQPQPTEAPPAAQSAPAAAPQSAAPAQASPPPAQKEGFFDALGKWWDKSAAEWDANMKKFKSKIDETNERNAKAAADATRDAVTATKDATDALMKFPLDAHHRGQGALPAGAERLARLQCGGREDLQRQGIHAPARAPTSNPRANARRAPCSRATRRTASTKPS